MENHGLAVGWTHFREEVQTSRTKLGWSHPGAARQHPDFRHTNQRSVLVLLEPRERTTSPQAFGGGGPGLPQMFDPVHKRQIRKIEDCAHCCVFLRTADALAFSLPEKGSTNKILNFIKCINVHQCDPSMICLEVEV